MENPALSSEVSTALDMVGQLKKGQKKKKKEKSADEERNPTDEFESRYNFDNYDDEEEDSMYRVIKEHKKKTFSSRRHCQY